MQIEKHDIVLKAFKGEPTERIPYSLWKHFVNKDNTIDGLVKATLAFQKKFDSDLLKISPHGNYTVVDFGGELGGYREVSGSRICTKRPIKKIEDWETLEPVDPNEGEFGNQIKAVKKISEKLSVQVPKIMTVFSPFMVGSKLDDNFIDHFKSNPDLLTDQLEMLTQVMKNFAKASIDAGADGIFLATQHFNEKLSYESRKAYEFDPMNEILRSTIKKGNLSVIHLHGENPDYELATKLSKLSAINWHDQDTPPSLIDARNMFKGGLMGGFKTDEWKKTIKKDDLESQILDVVDEYDNTGLLLAPGCVVPQFVTDKTLTNVVKIIKSIG